MLIVARTYRLHNHSYKLGPVKLQIGSMSAAGTVKQEDKMEAAKDGGWGYWAEGESDGLRLFTRGLLHFLYSGYLRGLFAQVFCPLVTYVISTFLIFAQVYSFPT